MDIRHPKNQPPPGRWRWWLIRLLLDLFYFCAAPILLFVLLVISRCFTSRKYRGWLEKFGAVARRQGDRPSIWIHAVSVGEVFVAVPLIRDLRAAYPEWDVSLSVSTGTGFDVARKQLPDITVFRAPVDFGPVLSWVFLRRRPTVVLMVELELWPGFLLTANSWGVPVYVVNGRLTERSWRRYLSCGRIGTWLFGLVRAYAVQNEEYAARFQSLGIDPARVAAVGNLKHDREPSPRAADGESIRDQLGWSRTDHLLVVAGSTHPDEEVLWCRFYEDLVEEFPQLRLALVPRHIERLSSAELARWPASRGLSRWSARRSDGGTSMVQEPLGETTLVVDTFGDLELFYYAADVVFVGGTMVPHGGHNLFEVAVLGRPLVFGPSYENFREEAELLLREEAAICARDEAELRDVLRDLLRDSERRQQLGDRARAVTHRLQGARRRHLAWLNDQWTQFFGAST